jgi:Flp pilus assembly protein CpaB
VPKGAITKLEDLKGRRPRTAIIEGEPILEGKLLAVGQLADPIAQIPKGMRMKTISVDAEKSAAGLLKPGDRVDVQLFVKKDQRSGVETAKSKIILQNVRVYAVDQAVQRSAEGADEKTIAKTISLLLTPNQASTLALAEQVGEISLVPRNPNDEDSADATEITVDDLLGTSEKNSRELEQGKKDAQAAKDKTAKEEQQAPSTGNSLVNAIKNTLAPSVKEPFHMEIVEAQAYREVLFDPTTGKPIMPANSNGVNSATIGPTLGSSKAPSASDIEKAGGDVPDHDSTSKLLDNFPINFDIPKK